MELNRFKSGCTSICLETTQQKLESYVFSFVKTIEELSSGCGFNLTVFSRERGKL